MCLKSQLHSDYFGNLNRVENVVDYLFVNDQSQFLLHICILIGLVFHLLRDKNSILLVFRVSSSGGVFLLNVSGNARFFPAVQTICKFVNFIKIS